jgi:hypothetical protein
MKAQSEIVLQILKQIQFVTPEDMSLLPSMAIKFVEELAMNNLEIREAVEGCDGCDCKNNRDRLLRCVTCTRLPLEVRTDRFIIEPKMLANREFEEKTRPTIQELEKILDSKDPMRIITNPDGSISSVPDDGYREEGKK